MVWNTNFRPRADSFNFLQKIYSSTLHSLPRRSLRPGQMFSQVNASSQLASTCDSVWPGLACTCDDLRSLWRDQICTQVDASFSPFGHPTQVSVSWVTSINLLLANEIQDVSALKWVFCDFCVLGRKLASPFGHPTQLSTQAQLVATCESVWPGLYVIGTHYNIRANQSQLSSMNLCRTEKTSKYLRVLENFDI